MCEGAYIATPPTEPVPTFEITEEYKEVIVVSGEVRCQDTREKLTAPCVVPRNVKSVKNGKKFFFIYIPVFPYSLMPTQNKINNNIVFV